MRVEIYSDIVCPWCYIGERRFERALAAFAGGSEVEVEVEFRPFQLDPTAPEAAVPLKDYLARRFGGNVDAMLDRTSAVAAGEGITIDWDRARVANTRSAHRVLEFALNEYGADVQRALAERLFAVHFTEGGDIGDLNGLADEAAAVGMDRARALAHLESADGRASLEAEFMRARRLGIRVVPTFVFDGRVQVQGAQSLATFLRALEETAAAAAGVGDGDGCEDGACAVPDAP